MSTGVTPPRPTPGPSVPRVPVAPLGVLAALVLLGRFVGLLPHWAGIVHLVALPPLDLIADLGLLLSRAEHPVVFVVGVTASLGVRVTVLAALLGRLDRDGLLLALRFYAVVWPFALVAAVLLYGAHAILFYALFWFGLVAALAVFGATGAVPWLSGSTLRSGVVASWRTWGRLGTLGSYLVGLVALGYLAHHGGPLVAVALVPVSASWSWTVIGFIRSDPVLVVPRRVLAGAFAASGGLLGAVAAAGPAGPPEPDPEGARRDGSLLLMSGIDSSSGSGAILEIDPRWLGYGCDQTFYFSYAGPGDGQPTGDARCPIGHGAPYGPEDTMRSRDEIVPSIEAFVEEMEPPVAVVAHSQAAWMAWEAAADGRLGDDAALILLGAFPDNPVTYRPEVAGVGTSPGRVAIMPFTMLPRPGGGTTSFDADSPLGVEWLAPPGAIADTLARSLPEGVRALGVPSAFDLPLKPGGHRIEGSESACPIATIHPNLPYSEEFGATVRRFLDELPVDGCPIWREPAGLAFVGFTVAPS
jgi:hypothetical protein